MASNLKNKMSGFHGQKNLKYSQLRGIFFFHTSKSLSEALILTSTNPQYDNRLFIELRVQYMKIPRSEHVVYQNCFLFLF